MKIKFMVYFIFLIGSITLSLCSNSSSLLKKGRLSSRESQTNEQNPVSTDQRKNLVIKNVESLPLSNDKEGKTDSTENFQNSSGGQKEENIETQRVDMTQKETQKLIIKNKDATATLNTEQILVSSNKKYRVTVNSMGVITLKEGTGAEKWKITRYNICANVPNKGEPSNVFLELNGSSPFIQVRGNVNYKREILTQVQGVSNPLIIYPLVLRVTDTGVLELRDTKKVEGDGNQIWSCRIDNQNKSRLLSASNLTQFNTLISGDNTRNFLISDNLRFKLTLARNGQLTITDSKKSNASIWTIKTEDIRSVKVDPDRNEFVAVIQGDGNFVIYYRNKNITTTDQGQVAWAIDKFTSGNEISTLILQDDGNLVIYDANFIPFWASGSNQPN